MTMVNHGHIFLIPKVDCPSKITQYRPITLCNITYKVISKVLANRLKAVIGNLVSPFQAAFVPGRHIHENSIMAHEVIHMMQKRKKGRKIMVLRADIEKVYVIVWNGDLSWWH